MLGSALKKQVLASEVIGVDIVPETVAVAGTVLDRAICSNIETADLFSLGLENGSFDHILCNDVLEHLGHPDIVLDKLARLLKDDGRLIASLPNVRHWSVVFPLLFKGDWEYRAEGILDATHLRFYTKRSAMQLFTGAGLNVQNCVPLTYRKIDRLGSFVSMGLLNGIFAYQWLFVTGKRNDNTRL